MPKYNLRQVLEKFKPRLAYKELDRTALEISRSVAAGNLGDDKEYSEWAMITNDPLVVVNYVKTYITLQVSKLSSAPYRPQDDTLLEVGINARLDSAFTEQYNDVLNDGYSFLGVGMNGSKPFVKPIDARYVMFNGDDPALRDATDVVVFEVVPLSLEREDDEAATRMACSFLHTYVEFDSNAERVKVSHYHKDKKTGVYVLDIYDDDFEKPQTFNLTGLDRIPVVRFVGERIELSDKRYHYRGLYYQTQSVLKALALAGTKIQIRTAASSDANFITRSDATANHGEAWRNSGTLPIDNVDQNGNDVPPIQFVPHDNDFLLSTFNNWKSVISDMLGPVVASGSEAVTREEVVARNEVRDAISNTYLSRMADSIAEVYRCIQMYMTGNPAEVVILGGYIESIKRKKDMEALTHVYGLAKEGGLNTQGLVVQMLALEDLPVATKQTVAASFQQEPFKSPQVLQLESVVQKLNQTIQGQNQQIALLRLQATQRLERQKEFIDSTERTKRLELALKQWTEEQKQTHEALMAVLNDTLSKGDYDGAIQTLEQIKSQDSPLLTNNVLNLASNAFSEENAKSVANALASTGQQFNPIQQPQQPNSVGPTPNSLQPVQLNKSQKQMTNVNAPAPRPAITTFNDA